MIFVLILFSMITPIIINLILFSIRGTCNLQGSKRKCGAVDFTTSKARNVSRRYYHKARNVSRGAITIIYKKIILIFMI